jgi:uncharacterized Zn-binding protein involved in type VI secretion
MASGLARLGDRTTGVCTAHKNPITTGGTIVSASGDVTANNLGIARLGDIVQADCGHSATIISSSSSVTVNNIPAARLGDMVGGGPYTGTIISASGDSVTG